VDMVKPGALGISVGSAPGIGTEGLSSPLCASYAEAGVGSFISS